MRDEFDLALKELPLWRKCKPNDVKKIYFYHAVLFYMQSTFLLYENDENKKKECVLNVVELFGIGAHKIPYDLRDELEELGVDFK